MHRLPLHSRTAPGTISSAAVDPGGVAAPTARDNGPSGPGEDIPEQDAERLADAVLGGAPPPDDAAEPGHLPGLLIEDGEPGAGQMTRADWLTALRERVRAAADAELAGTGRDARDCPYIELALRFYERQSAARIERDLLRFAPEARGARSAADYLEPVAGRVARSVARWTRDGTVTGLPPGMPGLGGILGGLGTLFFSGREGGARPPTGGAAALRAGLGEGHALAGPVRRRMEGAFGRSFAAVRIHTDGRARQLATRSNARAFAIGRHVGFAAGQYRPGEAQGDGLLAHELAHVAQQDEASGASGHVPDAQLEREADRHAIAAVARLHGSLRPPPRPSLRSRRRSGLRLLRCGGSTPQVRSATDIQRRFEEVRSAAQASTDDATTWAHLDMELGLMRATLDQQIEAAGGDRSRIAAAQQRFLDALERFAGALQRRVEMEGRYGIRFTTEVSFIPDRASPDGGYHIHRPWSAEELAIVDAALRQVPSQLLGAIEEIDRRPDEARTSATEPLQHPADWNETQRTITVYDAFFGPRVEAHQRARMLIHEVGHSTAPSQAPGSAGGFISLPPAAWMTAAGWQTLDLAAFTRLAGGDADDLLQDLREQKAERPNFPRPIEVGTMRVVFDKYEPGEAITRFLAYPDDRDDEFVSAYARTHPAEDLAESFAWLLLDPRDYPLQRSAREILAGPKLDHLEDRYPQLRVQRATPAAAEALGRRLERLPDADPSPDTDTGPETPESAAAGRPPAPATTLAAQGSDRSPGFIVTDDTGRPGPGRMRRRDFLQALRASACRAADTALAGTAYDAQGCRFLQAALRAYEGRSAADLEAALQRYAPPSARATRADDYLDWVATAIDHGMREWLRTGSLAAVPEELRAALGPSSLFGPLFLRRPGSATTAASDAPMLDAQLGAGRPLGGTQGRRMAQAFGGRLPEVALHTDPRAAALAERHGAAAFTVGPHIVFARNAYCPGTTAGDALLAHELMHVRQQDRGGPHSDEAGLEQDADRGAVAAVQRLWGLRGEETTAQPQRSTGLRLLRCGSSHQAVRSGAVTPEAPLGTLTPWQLRRLPDERIRAAAAAGTGPQAADYLRARQVARRFLDFDIDDPEARPGREPDAAELAILDRQLGQLLGTDDLRRLVASGRGGRGLPTAGSGETPTLRGRVRFVGREAFTAALYRLGWLVQGSEDAAAIAAARPLVAEMWRELDITPADDARITPQELRIAVYFLHRRAPWVPGLAQGHYNPIEDRIIIPDIVDLRTERGAFLARHETAHLIGGAEQLRRAFMARFGDAWFDWWVPFNEGMAEIIARSSLPPGTAPPDPADVDLGEGLSIAEERYEGFVTALEGVMDSSERRQQMMRAYATGEVPETVFALIAEARGEPLPPPPR